MNGPFDRRLVVTGSPMQPLVKVCGLTRREDAELAVDLGAAALGFVCWPKSPRYIDAERIRAIVDALPPFVQSVGVFVDQPVEDMLEVARVAGLQIIQLHGHEDAPMCARVGRTVIKSVAVRDDGPEVDPAAYPTTVTILLDAHDPVRKGGTGQSIDWSTAARVAAERRVILAGGLTAGNVGEAIACVHPYAIDVSSGVEREPGIKDARKLEALFQAGPANVERLVEHMRREEFVTTEQVTFGRRDPDARGYYGAFGGRFVPETLMAPIDELQQAYFDARADPAFRQTWLQLLRDYVGRPTPLSEAPRLSVSAGGAQLFFKREDLAHTGAHKINNALGQALLARRMGKTRIVAETGAGQHGVASATVCALLGLTCEVYMGAEDMERQALNVFRMQLLGATVRRVDAGSRTLKDAINEAMRDWVTNLRDTHYLLGSVLGPHPYPLMVREFQSIIGHEARAQFQERTGTLPDAIVACVGGGSNAMGIFDAFIADEGVRLIGVEAGGEAIQPGRHAARFAGGSPGVLQGTQTFVLQDPHGNIELTHSISAGLDYAAVGPEHAWLHECGRAEYTWVSDDDALAAFQQCAELEGILPALESSHAIAHACRLARELGPRQTVLVNLSGRGDKDVQSVEQALKKSTAAREPNA